MDDIRKAADEAMSDIRSVMERALHFKLDDRWEERFNKIISKHCIGKDKVREWAVRLHLADGLYTVVEEMRKALLEDGDNEN